MLQRVVHRGWLFTRSYSFNELNEARWKAKDIGIVFLFWVATLHIRSQPFRRRSGKFSFHCQRLHHFIVIVCNQIELYDSGTPKFIVVLPTATIWNEYKVEILSFCGEQSISEIKTSSGRLLFRGEKKFPSSRSKLNFYHFRNKTLMW